MPKYRTRTPRFVDGLYVHASVEAPAVIELPEGTVPDVGLELVVEGQPSTVQPPRPHYAVKGQDAASAAVQDGKKPKPAARATKDDPL